MSDFLDRVSKLSPKRLALLALELQTKLEALERGRFEPVAVVGLSCRFPGAAGADEFWQLLRDGVDAVTEMPPERRELLALQDPDPEAMGTSAARWGGYLDRIDRFEPQVFGISPREAASMDPQQRLLLEVGWEALENAGYAPDRLNGSATGVFVGLCNSDYAQLELAHGRAALDMYYATGGAHSVAAGRLSYVLGLQGPSFAVDTACSSSLVAVHLACTSLRNAECRMALAGGANLVLSADTTAALAEGNMLAPDGRCKAFDAAADGFVRSEGCGLLVLKRLADALADGDRVLAVLRGSAVNQDGRSNGLTAPNGPSQEAVLRQALANAGAAPGDVSYVETHGTGTSLGDPIEVRALGAVFGTDRSDKLLIGSVKTNIGHAESAAGIAGLIKVILALQHREIPPHLHFKQPSPYIPWDELAVQVPTTNVPWESAHGQRLAGVSSFGFGGTNAHVLVQEAPAAVVPAPAANDRPAHLLTLQARDDQALRELATRYAEHLAAHPDVSLADVAYTANTGRAQWKRRLAVVAHDAATAGRALAAFAAGDAAVPHGPPVIQGQQTSDHAAGPVMLFTGQGAQSVGMARALYNSSEVFRAAIERCNTILEPLLGRSLASLLYPPEGTPAVLNETRYAHPVLFAVEYALAELWQAWGIVPSAVIGHSAGEYVAACVAGVLSLRDALTLVATRARLIAALPADGEMAAVFAGPERVAAALAPWADRVSIAAINGADNLVISGDKVAVASALAQLNAQGVKGRQLAISIASHSPLMEPILDEYAQACRAVEYHAPQIGFYACVTGAAAGADTVNATYWRTHTRTPVRFADALQAAHAAGHRSFLEIGPAPTLIALGQRSLPPDAGVWLASLRPGKSDWEQMLTSLGELYVRGATVDWAALDREWARRRVALPAYPFQRTHHWFTAGRPAAAPPVLDTAAHPLLGTRLKSPALDAIVFESRVNATYPAFLSHHRILDLVIMPSPAYIEMVLEAARVAFGAYPVRIENLAIQQALLLPQEGWRTVQLILTPLEDERATFQIYSRDQEQDTWTLHTTGGVRLAHDAAPDAVIDRAAIAARCGTETAGTEYYARLAELGLEFGSGFRGITQFVLGQGEALGDIRLPEELAPEAARYTMHPALLDACFHLLGAPLPVNGPVATYLLVGLESLRLYRDPGTRVYNHTVLSGDLNGETFAGDIRLLDEAGHLVAEIQGVQLRRATRETLWRITHRAQPGEHLYAVEWARRPLPMPTTPRELANGARARYAALAAQHDLAAYRLRLNDLDAQAVAYVRQAFAELGWRPQLGERIVTAGLATQLGIAARYARVFARWIEMLGDAGDLRSAGTDWFVGAQGTKVRDMEPALPDEPAGGFPERELTRRCGEQLARVLRGDVDPLALLFPDGSTALTEPIYVDSPFARIYNALVAETIAASLPPERTVRILEIGAGTGGTTRALLPLLPAGRTEYVFTDVSAHFLARARDALGRYPFVRYATLDIERDPVTQGMTAHSFDVVIAANVLHATADLAQTLAHVKTLLAPDGLLVLMEGTRPQPWVDVTFGLTEGWWRFTDTALRSKHPLLAKTKWLELLAATGFEQAASIPEDGDQVILLARAPVTAAVAPGTRWLILADQGGVGEALAQLLATHGEPCDLVRSGEMPSPLVFGKGIEDNGPALSVIDLRALDEFRPAEQAPSTTGAVGPVADMLCERVVQLIQTPAAPRETRLWIVTRNAQSALGNEPALAIVQAPLWGLGRVLALEHPERWGGLIDLPADGSPAADAHRLFAELIHSDGEDQVAYRGADRMVPRLVPHAALPPHRPPVVPDGTYLVTGGLGGLGRQVALWLAEQGARHLVLVGRTALPDDRVGLGDQAEGESKEGDRGEGESKEGDHKGSPLQDDAEMERRRAAIQAMRACGAEVTVVTADVGNRQEMEALFAHLSGTHPPLRGILHLAADLSNWPLDAMPPAALRNMLHPKIAGTWNLHELSHGLPLDWFVCFSSTTALWGSQQMAHYAAANAFLDSFAHYRAALGLPALTINWGTWEEMRVTTEQERSRVSRFGLTPIPTAQALDILGAAMGVPELTQVAAAAVDWSLLKPAYEARGRRPLLERVGTTPAAAPVAVVEKRPDKREPDLVTLLANARPENRREVIAEHIRQAVAHVLGMDAAHTIDDEQGLFEMGVDSLMSVELKSRLETASGRALPSTLTFNYPNVAALTGYLDRLLSGAGESVTAGDRPAGATEPAVPAAAGAALDELSEDELAHKLAARLAQIK